MLAMLMINLLKRLLEKTE
jgi:hypothetical protein